MRCTAYIFWAPIPTSNQRIKIDDALVACIHFYYLTFGKRIYG